MGKLGMDYEDYRSAREANLRRALEEPMPPELKARINALVVPTAVGMQIRHEAAMECIDVSFPVIRDWLREHPEH